MPVALVFLRVLKFSSKILRSEMNIDRVRRLDICMAEQTGDSREGQSVIANPLSGTSMSQHMRRHLDSCFLAETANERHDGFVGHWVSLLSVPKIDEYIVWQCVRIQSIKILNEICCVKLQD